MTAGPVGCTPNGDKVVFHATDAGGDHGLWWSDGTSAGTSAIDSQVQGDVTSLAVLNGWIYYTDSDLDHGSELWRTNGTTKTRLTDINDSTEPETPGEDWDDSMMDSNPYAFAVAGGRLVFIADDTTYTTKFEFGVWSGPGSSPVTARRFGPTPPVANRRC